jgi:signal transduction histidine kinase
MADVADTRILKLVAALGDRGGRERAAAVLAEHLGAEALLLFVPDPQLGVLLPAPGMAQTIRGGARWREFLANCRPDTEVNGIVDLPAGDGRRAYAICRRDVVACLLGGELRADRIAELVATMPLLGALLQTELALTLAMAEARSARDSADRAQTLSAALEAARAEQARLNAALRREDQRKDEFLAMLGHELRNPLAPLLASLEILRHSATTPAERDRYIEIMRRQLSHLTRLVDDLLDVARVSRGRVHLQRAVHDIQTIVTDALEACHPLMQAQRQSLTLEMPGEPLKVNVDSTRMVQVLTNLLNNAAKYSDPESDITVTVTREADRVRVRVRDTGIGISPEVLPRVFDLFTQGPEVVERSQGGLGVGLTMVQLLVRLHGGSVTAESAGPGRGSTFTVRLPLAQVQVKEHDGSSAERRGGWDHRALRVLIVDDNHDAADSMVMLLRLMGQQGSVAYSGEMALQLAADIAPDLVLLDLGLPDVDGFEVARRLRRSFSTPPRLVALTGYGSEEDRQRTHEAGFDEHVTKPVAPDVLREVLLRAGA